MSWWQKTLHVGPWLTQAMGLSCATSNAAMQLLVVPGNPGLGSFYQCFMAELHSVFNGAVEVMAVSHVGHDSDNLSQGKVWCLDSQIAHKVALLKEHVLAPGKPPAIIIAHSIGSFIMLQAIKQLEEEAAAAAGDPAAHHKQLAKVVLLMPFLAADWGSTRQRVLRFAANFAPVLGAAAGAVGSLPHWLQDRLLGLVQPGVEAHARQSMKDLMGQTSVHNNFLLAQHEFRDLNRPVDWDLIQRLGDRAAVVCAPNDMWFPNEHYKEMRSALPGIEEYWHEGLTHAFCVEAKQCQQVAQLVHQSVMRSLPHLGGLASQPIPTAAASCHPAEDLAPKGQEEAADVDILLEDDRVFVKA